jgi:hypothetical protein
LKVLAIGLHMGWVAPDVVQRANLTDLRFEPCPPGGKRTAPEAVEPERAPTEVDATPPPSQEQAPPQEDTPAPVAERGELLTAFVERPVVDRPEPEPRDMESPEPEPPEPEPPAPKRPEPTPAASARNPSQPQGSKQESVTSQQSWPNVPGTVADDTVGCIG